MAEHGPTCPVVALTLPEGVDSVAGLPTNVALLEEIQSWQLAPLVLRLPLSTAADAKPRAAAALSAKEGK